MERLANLLAQKLSKHLDTPVQEDDIERPDIERGDYAYPVMKAAAETGDNPRHLAEKTASKLKDDDLVKNVSVAGPGYINIQINRETFAKKVEATVESDNMGVKQQEGTVLIEFSSPNVAKPMHVGHFRNNALGDSLQRILQFVGYDVTSENYLGDWGTQYGKLIYAFKQYGSMDEFKAQPMEHMFDLYVRFHEEMEDNKEMEEKGREWAAKIEKGDKEAVQLWEQFRNASIEYHKKDYDSMDISFDRWTGESTVVDEARTMVEKWLQNEQLERDDDGSVFIEFENQDIPGTVLLKADGSTLYITRDLYNLKKRNSEGFDHNLYVVGSEQDLHFKQVFAAAEKLGIDADGAEHISYGLLSLPEGSMSSRQGRIIRLEHAINESVERAKDKAEEKIDRTTENAEAIGIGALKYANLAVSRTKNIEFSWEQALSFEGSSGPYIQYSNTRAKSIVSKATVSSSLKGTTTDNEHQLLRKLEEFPATVERSARQREPSYIANYLTDLCEEFNSFYHNCPVLDAQDSDTKQRRLRIVQLFITVTDQGMKLLGIKPLNTM